jgi:uncharacterized protein YcgI (DUF1989 family)
MAKELLTRDQEFAAQKPAVPGNCVEYIYIPPRGFMAARLVKKGQAIRIISVLGAQCADMVMWDADNFDNVLNCCMSMLLNKKWNGWQKGDTIYSKHCEPLAVFGEDTTGGTHAALGPFCNEPYWRKLTGIAGCPNCRDNLVAAMAKYSFRAEDLDWSSCISLFMSVTYEADGTITENIPSTTPGNFVDFVAERDVIVAVSNCPEERRDKSQCEYDPTPLQIVIFDPDDEYQAELRTSMGR